MAGALLAFTAWAAAAPPAAPPAPSGLIERTGRRLAQLDVTVSGPREAIENLGPDDFELTLGIRKIHELSVDRICHENAVPAAETAAAAGEPAPAEPPAVRPAPTTFVFYFDQPHLTMEGRQRALDLTRELVPKLVHDGNRASIVSSGKELVTLADSSTEPAPLLEALGRLEHDFAQFDPFAQQESERVEEVYRAMGTDISHAQAAARRYSDEERWRTDKALRRFSLILGRLAEVSEPKAVLYFADTMRSNAGEHYRYLFPTNAQSSGVDPYQDRAELAAFAAGNPFEKAIDAAAAEGVRVYTIQAQGLVSHTSTETGPAAPPPGRGRRPVPSRPIPATARLSDAQKSLSGLAAETGGRAFLNGVPAIKIADQINGDLACIYVLSFDPTGLKEDSPLAVTLRVKRPKVDAQVRGRLVIQSESARRTSRLLAAFASPHTAHTDARVAATLVPIGYEDHAYRALVQVAVPASPLRSAQWDLGASLVARGKVREDASGRIVVTRAGTPVVLESEMRFAPGPFEIVMVAHDTTLDEIATGQVDGDWPDPDATAGVVGPIVVLQPAGGAFLRDGTSRVQGTLGHGPDEAVRPDLPTALVALVCRGPHKKKLRVERRLVGETSAEFGTMELDLRDQACAQIRDVVRAGTLTEGDFRYELRLLDGDEELATSQRAFVAVAPTAAPAASVQKPM
ncbi:MAG TPA: hypothetical protein VJS92_11005 [Candidatus Polarisedimenticolaceae bacterium]|nr:hypothetical protein [Candidatus Polarisedimenticolaceae bacterium]